MVVRPRHFPSELLPTRGQANCYLKASYRPFIGAGAAAWRGEEQGLSFLSGAVAAYSRLNLSGPGGLLRTR